MRFYSGLLKAFFGIFLLGMLMLISMKQGRSEPPVPNSAVEISGNLQPSPAAPKTDVENGYSLDQYPGFPQKWHFVTSRYRKDTGEMRMTYANDIAWAALLKHTTDYPDGAVFGKIGIMTQEDPAFASSAVPSGVKRYMLMVRDKKKHADTKGWGYAMFIVAHERHPSAESQKIEARACSACHELVPDRGYVFSQPVSLAVAGQSPVHPAEASNSSQFFFTTEDASAVLPLLKENLPPSFTKVRLLHAPFKVIFGGTMLEVHPMLIKEVMRTGLPAAMTSNAPLFSLAYINPEKPDCTVDGKKGADMITLYTWDPPRNPRRTPQHIEKHEYCEARP